MNILQGGVRHLPIDQHAAYKDVAPAASTRPQDVKEGDFTVGVKGIKKYIAWKFIEDALPGLSWLFFGLAGGMVIAQKLSTAWMAVFVIAFLISGFYSAYLYRRSKE